MEHLLQKSARLIQSTQSSPTRYLYEKISWNNRLIGIKGARGTGKSTILLQRLKSLDLSNKVATYWSLDDLYFLSNSL